MTSEEAITAPAPVIRHPALAAALAERGYSSLTAVQAAVIGEEVGERDLLVSAQTACRAPTLNRRWSNLQGTARRCSSRERSWVKGKWKER